MHEENIINVIYNNAPKMVMEDVDQALIDRVVSYYDNRIVYFAKQTYCDNKYDRVSSVAIEAFKEQTKQELLSALNTFIFTKQHWRDGRNLNSYLIKTIRNLSSKIKLDKDAIKRANVLVCPLCKLVGRREPLVSESRLWRCSHCSSEAERISDEIGKENDAKLSYLQGLYIQHKAFSLHSRRGYRCPECSRFIPHSVTKQYGAVCPYHDCMFFGSIDGLEPMNHPVGSFARKVTSLNVTIKSQDNSNNKVYQDIFKSDDMSPEDCLDIQARIKEEYEVLLSVINDQMEAIKRTNSERTMTQKLLMYKAYKVMLNKYPEEIISYLVHRKQQSDFPIQSRIFQEYVKLMENYLPFTINKGNEKIDIVSLTDPDLSLFLGVSKFGANVNYNHIIPNKTKETYVGGRKFKDYGPCFIGRLIDVIDNNTNQSILDKVKEYSFVQIIMDESVEEDTPVTVTHFRIPSHYEMDSLVFLQRIRRQIVDSVYFRLNNKKREIGDNK